MLGLITNLIRNPFRPTFLVILLLINIVGSVWGYFWYQNQLAATPLKYWLFVPDCPFATTLMSILLVVFLTGRRNSTFELITYIALIKYGLWTVSVLSFYGLTGGVFDGETWMLLISHAGMVLQGLFFIRHLEIKVRDVYILVPWMFLNDFMDYGVGVYPYLPNPAHLAIVAYFTLFLSILISLLLFRKGLQNKFLIFRTRKS